MTRTTKQVEIERTSEQLRRRLSWLFGSLAVLFLLERFGAVALALIQNGFTSEATRRFALASLAACPEVLYLVALWWIREAVGAFARGTLYSEEIARIINRVGSLLAAGAFISVFLLPGASRLIGFDPGYLIAYDVPSLVLGAVGLSFNVIAHVLQRAAEVQAELDEIF